MESLSSEFVSTLEAVASELDFKMVHCLLQNDGFVEILFADEEDREIAVDVRFCEKTFYGKKMLEVRVFDQDSNRHNFFISAVPALLFHVASSL